MPKRIQRKRSKGWKMPDNTIYVGRPTKWGNPYNWKDGLELYHNKFLAKSMAMRFFDENLSSGDLSISKEEIRNELRGKNLACWCKEGEPCHADILLEVANL